MDGERNLKDLFIGLTSLFVGTSFSYWISDFLIDFGYVSQNLAIILFTIFGFILVPVTFWIVEGQIKRIAETSNQTTLVIIIILVVMFGCITLATLIAGKIH